MILRSKRKVRQADYLAGLEAQYGSIARLERLAARNPFLRPELYEWKKCLTHPERGDQILTFETRVVPTPGNDLLDLLSVQRIRMIEYLRQHRDIDSLNELAKRLHRNYRNVYEDARRLEKWGVIALERKTNRVVPRVLSDSIEIQL